MKHRHSIRNRTLALPLYAGGLIAGREPITRWLAWALLAWCVIQAYQPVCVRADVTLPFVFANHMVLQRDTPLPVWGSATPGEEVTVTFGDSSASTMANAEGLWSLSLPKQRATNTPKALTVQGKNTIKLRDVVVGEVWLCAGQSNMEWPLNKTVGSAAAIAEAERSDVRLLDRVGAARGGSGVYNTALINRLAPDKFMSGTWRRCTAKSAASFSAVAYYFGLRMANELDVPIGLIDVAIGGTPTEAWIAPQAMAGDPGLRALVQGNWLGNDKLGPWCRQRARYNLSRALKANDPIPGDTIGPNHSFKPGYMWQTGVAPIAPFAVRGVLWYQGESNAQLDWRVTQHEALFRLLIADWRARWRRPNMPFAFVQLPGMNRPNWPAFRDQQRRIAQTTQNVGMAITIDLGARNDVHPRDKRPVGERLAQWALAAIHNRRIAPSGPLPRRALGKGRSVVVTFDHADGLTTSDKQPPVSFEIAGPDGDYHAAQARIVEGAVTVRSDKVAKPMRVRYAWLPYPDSPVNLVNASNLPTSPFELEVQR